MEPGPPAEKQAQRISPYSAADVATILRERDWLGGESSPDISAWCEEAAALLGPQAADRGALEDLLEFVFHFDARELLGQSTSHALLAREGAREVLRELAALLLGGPEVDSDRYKEIIRALKERTGCGGQRLFHPVRLALAGRGGEGELDRVILLLDRAARLPFRAAVKSNRQRILEFCAAMD